MTDYSVFYLSIHAGVQVIKPEPSLCVHLLSLLSEVTGIHIQCFVQGEDKQKSAQLFSKLQAAMKILGISSDEQKAFWLILGAIYHLGSAGATKGINV